VLIVLILLAGVMVNHYYAQQPWPLRLLAWLVLCCVVLGVAWRTRQGQRAAGFARDARAELRKVTWPTRQETIQTTLIVAVLVVVFALILWGVDGMLTWAVGVLIGQRG
jgi:preprotein translocase subunit SecE